MTVAKHDINYFLDIANELASRVAEVADTIEANKELPADLAHDIADQGFFRLLVPRSLGGYEMDYPDFQKIVEIFGRVDASIGWCINQNNVRATDSVRMPEETAQEIWSEQRAVITNGPPTASSIAVRVDGGYRLSGRWNFSSGSDHATWIVADTPVKESDSHGSGSSYSHGSRVLLMPKKDVKLVDTWNVHGLRGTASYSFDVNDLFVPDHHSFSYSAPSREPNPMYALPITLFFSSGFSTVALANARASLDIAIEMAGGRVPRREQGKLRDSSTTQRDIGKAHAMLMSARAFQRQSINETWDSICKNGGLTTGERIQLRLATTHAIRVSAEVVDVAYNMCGSSAIFESNPIQRRFQDAHVITQHLQGRLTHYDSAGQYYLGLEPKGQF